MTRLMLLAVVLAFCLPVHAAEPEKDFKPIAVDGDDVAAVSTQKQPRGTRVRVRLVTRGNGGAIRVGIARTMEAGVTSMTIVDTPSTKMTFSETVSGDGFVAVAAGPKETPLTLETIEADPTTAGATKLTFAGGMVVEVTLVPPHAAATRRAP